MADLAAALPYFITSVPGETLTITLANEFDLSELKEDWARGITAKFPGPYVNVRIVFSLCHRASSTCYAGLVHFNNWYRKDGAKPVVLVKPDLRMMHSLAMLQLDTMFVIEPRGESPPKK